MSLVKYSRQSKSHTLLARLAKVLFLLAIFFLAACSAVAPSSKSNSPAQKAFTSKEQGFSFQYPVNLKLQHTFNKSYLSSAGWKVFMAPDSAKGKPVVCLILPCSNKVRTGELRIGISRNAKAVQNYDHIPSIARAESKKFVNIDGVKFLTFRAGSAGMNHYLNVRSYRGVHDEICYAIDILIIGTNGQVYDPPKKPPFSKQKVWQTFAPIIKSLKFFKPEAQKKTNAKIFTKNLPATYKGTLPCADCPGIDYTINFLDNYKYVEQLNYLGRPSVYTQSGIWRFGKQNDVIELSNRKKSIIEQWQLNNNSKTITLLNKEGKKIKSNLNFSLKRSKVFMKIKN